MDREEYREKLDQLTDAVSDRDYTRALNIADEIDWRRVKSLNTLNMVADIYEMNREYESEKKILLLAYEKASIGRSILYRLVEVCLKLNQIGEAEKYFKEYSKTAKNDSSRCVLQYKLYKATKAPLEAQIDVLEEYRDKEYTERWAYELATLYAKAGDKKRCVDTCDDLILWFGDGKYVLKAMRLKMRYAQLTPSQEKSYRRMMDMGGYDSAPREIDRVEADAEDRAGARLYHEAGLTSSGREKTAPHVVASAGQRPDEEKTSAQVKTPVQGRTPVQDKKYGNRAADAGNTADMTAEDTDEDTAENSSAADDFSDDVDRQPDSSDTDTTEVSTDSISAGNEHAAAKSSGGFRNRVVRTISDIIGAGSDDRDDMFGDIDAEYRSVDDEEPEEQTETEGTEQGLHLRQLKDDLHDHTKTPDTEAEDSDGGETDADRTKVFRRNSVQVQRDGSLDLSAFLSDSAKEMASDISKDEVDEEPLPSADSSAETGATVSNADAAAASGDEADAGVASAADETEEADAAAASADEADAGVASAADEMAKADAAAASADDASEADETAEADGTAALAADDTAEADTAATSADDASEADETAEPENATEMTDMRETGEAADMTETNADTAVKADGAVEISADSSAAGNGPVVAKSAADALQGLKEGVEAEKAQAEKEEAVRAAASDDDTDMKVVPDKPKKKPHYIEELEVPDPEPSPEEKKHHTHTISLDTIGENTVPISIDKILSEETPEERRIRILNKAKPTRMSEEQRKIFTYFARVPGMDGQILEAVNSVYTHAGEKTSMHGNIAIMGARGCGKSRLAHGLIVAMCRDLGLEACKMARINGKTLNKKDAAKVISVMAGGFLIIEDISNVTEATLKTLNQAMEFRTDRLVVIIEDEKTRMRAFLKSHPQFAAKFDKVISVPVFTNDELVTFARTYATENGCKIDDLAILALYTIIGNMQSEEEPATISDVKEIIDGAILHATKGRRRHGSYDAEKTGKWIIIHEKDLTANG